MIQPAISVPLTWRESCAVALRFVAQDLGGEEGALLEAVADRVSTLRSEYVDSLEDEQRVALLAFADQELARVQHESVL